jgi:XTP/dITP diphosphohydrolase
MGRVLAPTGTEIVTLADFPEAPEVVEDGGTFAENAAKKAREYALFFKRWTVAEDSGLSVDALDGAPGIYSSRFSGVNHTDEKNNELLLEKLRGVPIERRTAHYTCSMAFADPTGKIRFACEEYCCGRILFEQHGRNGFGYDPLFEVIEYHRTFGDLSPLLKSIISHRARSTRRFIAAVGPLLGEIAAD